MLSLTELWLPILASAVMVFVVSSIIYMVLPYHRSDHGGVPTEDELMDDLRKANLQPGEYVVPHASTPKDMAGPEYVDKMTRGPVAFITVLPSGPPSITKNLVLWFLYALLVSILAAYVAGRALGPAAQYLDIFRFTGTTALAAYAMGVVQQSIWYGRPWATTLKASFDGVVYALATAGVFGWLWPI
ncbi:MAG: hypothetical protein WD737_10955 [Gemmatimonadota bacterium]